MALIPDLPAASSLSNTDLLVIDTGSATQKITGANLAQSIVAWRNQALGSYANTTSDAWEKTTLSVTVPTGHYYLIYLNSGWSNGRPIGLGLGGSSDTVPNRYFETTSSDAMYNTPIFLVEAGTYYLFVKRGGTGLNAYSYSAIDLKML